MRNERFTLDQSQAGKVGGYTRIIRNHMLSGKALTVSFVKRDGTPRVISGQVVELTAKGSASTVTIDTAQGPRSANLWSIKGVKAHDNG